MKLIYYFVLGFLLFFSIDSFAKTETIRIGVLSHRGGDNALKVWSPLSIYLSKQLSPLQFEIVPLKFNMIAPKVASKNIDFLLVNPGIYVNMEVKYRVSRIVTLKKVENGGHSLNKFAGVAFTLASRKDINSYPDLVNKKFIAVDKTSLGGFQMVWRELHNVGINPFKDFSSLDFSGTHDAVVIAILQGKYDAGTVRTGILEKMDKEGRIKLADFKIISPKIKDSFPLRHSTRLYPEWPFSKLQHTSNDLAQKVAIALLNMPDSHTRLTEIDYAGWTVPLDYQDIHTLFKALSLAPYTKPVFTLYDAVKKYWQWALIILIILFLMGVVSLLIIRLNRQLFISNKYLERQYDLILDSVCDGIYGIDLDGKCTFMNSSMESTTGWSSSEMIGKCQHELLHHTREDGSHHPDKECPVYLTMNDQNPRFIKDDIFWKKDGTSFPVEYSSTPLKDHYGQIVGGVVVFRDISERRQAEENTRKYQYDLAHMGRLNTMGEMASGIAHELNQPLTAITTSAYAAIQLLETGNASSDKIVDILEKINKHAERSGDIIRHLRKLIRREQPSYTEVNINDLIDDVLTLMKPEIKKAGVDIECNYEDKLPIILCQSIQIDQVVLNLCKNAIESMQEIAIDTSSAPVLSKALLSEHVLPKQRVLTITTQMGGKHAVIVSISDTGQGIKEEVKNGLFDPFISSKKEGMGLGLSISKGIIEAHRGNLYLVSGKQSDTLSIAKSMGTTFRFVLPSFDNKYNDL